MPANFKTYEAQARLLAAVIAAHPELRLNYKAIAQHYGKSATMSAIEHRFRPVRKQADCLRLAVARGDDPEEIDIHEARELAKYFGESTADGLQFQFRGVKQAAEAMKNAADNGKDPIEAFMNAGSGSGANKTPSGRKRGRQAGGTPASGRSRGGGTPATGKSTTTTAKPRRSTAKKASYVEPHTTTDKDESAASVDYDALDDDSPTGHLAKKTCTTPIKAALPPRRMSGAAAPIAQPVFKTEALDEIFEVSDRLPSPSPMPPAITAAAVTISATGSNTCNGDYFGSSNMTRNDRAASEYHTPAPEFPLTTQSQSQSQSQSISYSNAAGMSFDGGVSTSFSSSTTNIFGGNTSVGNNYDTNSSFHNNGVGGGYSKQQPQQTTQQSAGYINIVSDDEDDYSQSQSVLGATRTLAPHGGQGNFSQPSLTTTSVGMGMNLPSTMTGNSGGGDLGFYVDEDQYEI
ncbi:hypothetical protein QBC32DRAFT_316580 [Pseudoneurospora amorphoporcata]|uniref:Uncharacterized protein n=1 Tax=Pseudoneurospora amorphoporcata TaxID=241081 RepID=A0AAN6NPM6_9PEZI|nr:hypothetical protein QBC32DRAFT_316580 [Pseudoneurospora amorphoporcata]